MRPLVIALLFILLTPQVLATDAVEQVLQQQVEAIDAQSVAEALPDDARARYEGFDHLLQADLDEGIRQILSSSISDAESSWSMALESAGKLLAVCVLVALTGSFCESGAGSGARLAGVMAITLISARDLHAFVGLGRTTLEEMSTFSAVLLPMLSAATTASGAPASATALYAGTMFFAQILNRVLLQMFLPLTYACLACACAEHTMNNTLLHRMRIFLQALVGNGLKGMLICFSVYLAVTGVVSGSADAASVKAAKLALSSIVPVVGSVIADASETVLVSAGILRNAVGITGLLGVLAVCAVPFIRLGMQYLILKATAALGAVLESGALSNMITAAADTMGMILAMVGVSALFNLVACVCFMRLVVPG